MPTYIGKFQVFKNAIPPATHARIRKNAGDIVMGMILNHEKPLFLGRKNKLRENINTKKTKGRESTWG
jgi:hypothetical protein